MKGSAAEALAARFLEQNGLHVICRNYRCRFGEIDLVARDGDALVFVEVRSRTSETYGGAAESITAAKRSRLIKAAHHYLARETANPAARFDAVLIGATPQKLVWIRDAFGE